VKYQHKKLAAGKWNNLSLIQQLANIGSEVERTISWNKKGNNLYSKKAFWRCLELIDITLADRKNKLRLRELTRLREALVDYFIGDNQYSSSDELWHKYFFAFNYAARINI